MINWLAMASFCAATAGGARIVEVSARLEAGPLAAGDSATLVVEYRLAEGYALTKNGVPRPIVQVDVPASVELTGDVLTDTKQLARNEYLHAPYEVSMVESSARIPFKMKSAKRPGDRIAVNFIAYVRAADVSGKGGSGDRDLFVRRRLEVPLMAGAIGVVVDARVTTWGADRFLDVGDEADDFTLPRADGSTVHLGDFRGKRNVIVTTYRAFW